MLGLRIERRRWLVENQHQRVIAHEPARQRELLMTDCLDAASHVRPSCVQSGAETIDGVGSPSGRPPPAPRHRRQGGNVTDADAVARTSNLKKS
jgi:hypothetical protein